MNTEDITHLAGTKKKSKDLCQNCVTNFPAILFLEITILDLVYY